MSKSQEPLVSIILLNYNGEKFASLWESLFKIDYSNYELIFVDNGSNSNRGILAIKELSERYPTVKVKIIKLKRNIGYSRGNNVGLKYAEGDYVVLLSNDIEVDKNFLTNMINAMEKYKNIAVAQSAMYSFFNKQERDDQRNYVDMFGFCHPPHLTTDIEDVFYSEGAVMFIRRNIINEVGGLFDPDYFMFDEDIDFCWRVRLRGYRVCVVRKSKVYHARGGTVAGVTMKTNPFYVYLIVRNKLITFFKYLDSVNIIKYLPLVLFANFVKGIWLMYKGKNDAGVACFRGIYSFIKTLPVSYKKRKKAQIFRRVGDKEIFKYVYPLNKAIVNLLMYARKASREWGHSKK